MYTISDIAKFLTNGDNNTDDTHPDTPRISIHPAALAGHLRLDVRYSNGATTHWRIAILPDTTTLLTAADCTPEELAGAVRCGTCGHHPVISDEHGDLLCSCCGLIHDDGLE